MSIPLIVTGGFGTGTLVGDVNNITVRGYLAGVTSVPACANIVITSVNASSIGLLAASVATPALSLSNVSAISLGVINGASVAFARANTATISITDCN